MIVMILLFFSGTNSVTSQQVNGFTSMKECRAQLNQIEEHMDRISPTRGFCLAVK